MRIFIILTFLLLPLVGSAGNEADFDWQGYSKLLSENIAVQEVQGIRSHLLDYSNIKQDQRLLATLAQLSRYDPSTLSGNSKKAFYINAYNILAIKMILDHQPEQSIKDIGNWFNPVWKREAGMIDGKAVSLDYIEHQVLRPMADPRIHFAIVCASLSCPDLRTEAYSPAQLDDQLEDQAQQFLANNTKGLTIEEGHLKLSKIFDWFEKDFSHDLTEKNTAVNKPSFVLSATISRKHLNTAI